MKKRHLLAKSLTILILLTILFLVASHDVEGKRYRDPEGWNDRPINGAWKEAVDGITGETAQIWFRIPAGGDVICRVAVKKDGTILLTATQKYILDPELGKVQNRITVKNGKTLSESFTLNNKGKFSIKTPWLVKLYANRCSRFNGSIPGDIAEKLAPVRLDVE